MRLLDVKNLNECLLRPEEAGHDLPIDFIQDNQEKIKLILKRQIAVIKKEVIKWMLLQHAKIKLGDYPDSDCTTQEEAMDMQAYLEAWVEVFTEESIESAVKKLKKAIKMRGDTNGV